MHRPLFPVSFSATGRHATHPFARAPPTSHATPLAARAPRSQGVDQATVNIARQLALPSVRAGEPRASRARLYA
eukprot:6200678-Pleurochrysis_carterae.AAC.5